MDYIVRPGFQLARHFLKADMSAGSGNEQPWAIGEERTITGRKKIALCSYGYHSSPSWYDALSYAPGSMACIVEISDPVDKDESKQVSKTRKLIAAVDIEATLRLWACDCAERALLREREHGREPDSRSWNAIAVARRFSDGQATKNELDAAGDAARAAARDAAWDAARAAAWAAAGAAAGDAAWAAARAAARDAAWAAAWAAAGDAAWDAARAAARDAAWDAARAAEIEWQKQALQERIDALFAAVTA